MCNNDIADTYRAAAIEQLEVWAKELMFLSLRVITNLIHHLFVMMLIPNQSIRADYLICDTAGRLHTRHNLMEELKKYAELYLKTTIQPLMKYLGC